MKFKLLHFNENTVEVEVFNERMFADLGDLDTHWELSENGVVIREGHSGIPAIPA